MYCSTSAGRISWRISLLICEKMKLGEMSAMNKIAEKMDLFIVLLYMMMNMAFGKYRAKK
jgi:hypothetical protein